MKIAKNLTQATLSLIVAVLTFIPSPNEARADTPSTRHQIKVLGDCAQYFREERQVIGFKGTKKCSFKAHIGLIQARNSRIVISISRRLLNIVSIPEIAPRISRQFRTFAVDSNGDVRGKFLLHGKDGFARYNLRIPRESDIKVVPPLPETCDEIESAFIEESFNIRSCSKDADCGQVLKGTSCGCTRDWVARNDANPEKFYTLIDLARSKDCISRLPLTSACDCPSVTGYGCNYGICGWISE